MKLKTFSSEKSKDITEFVNHFELTKENILSVTYVNNSWYLFYWE